MVWYDVVWYGMVNHRRAGGEYTVIKMNRKTYTLEDKDGGRVKCSIGLISPINNLNDHPWLKEKYSAA